MTLTAGESSDESAMASLDSSRCEQPSRKKPTNSPEIVIRRFIIVRYFMGPSWTPCKIS
jgi:hypothetical protein